ncbi:MAG: SDR family oxidoreductase [Prochloraceae cyanobacterium]
MQTVLITGSNRGLGYEFTAQYLEQGARAIACCRQPKTANKLQLLKTKYDRQLTIVPLDVSKESSIIEAFKLIKNNFNSIDLLINNAGIGLRKTLDNFTFEDLTNIFLINAAAPLIVSRTFLPLLMAGNRPIIANITSQLGSITLQQSEFTGIGSFDYNPSKAALNMISVMLASSLKNKGIIVLTQSPGWASTDLGGSNAPNSPEEVVSGMIKIFNSISLQDTGKYYEWTGKELPW